MDGGQVYTRYANTKGISYRSMYDRLLKAIKVDTDIIGNPYKQAKLNITYYPTHGKVSNFDGHTQLWDAQKSFHVNREKVIEFVDNVFQKIVNEKDELSPELKKYSKKFYYRSF